jgi:phytoene synthase
MARLDGKALAAAAAGSSFGWSFLLLPKHRRLAMRILYAFCRQVDDLADEAPSVEAGRRGLMAWLECLQGRPAASPLEEAVGWIIHEHGVPASALQEVVEGALSDLRPLVRFDSRAEVERYCHQVAGAVGLACLPLFGAGPGQGAAFAEALGQALQGANILRDVREDALRGRLYFARQDLARHGVDEAAWMRLKPGAGALPLLAEHAERVQARFDEARRLGQGLPGADLRPAWAMADVYEALLHQMRAQGFKAFEARPRASAWLKLRCLLKQALRPAPRQGA